MAAAVSASLYGLILKTVCGGNRLICEQLLLKSDSKANLEVAWMGFHPEMQLCLNNIFFLFVC